MEKTSSLPEFNIVAHSQKIGSIDVIDDYSVGAAHVYIGKKAQYLVIEPSISTEIHSVFSNIMRSLYQSLEPMKKSDDPVKYITTHMWEHAEQEGIVNQIKQHHNALQYYLVRDVLGYGILDVPMKDDMVEEITSERFDYPVGIVHRKHNEESMHILDSNIIFGSMEIMNEYVSRIIQQTGKTVTAATPILDSMTFEGDRVTVTYGREVSLPGPTITIRRFPKEPYSIVTLLKFNMIDKFIAAYIWTLIDAKSFSLIVGETGSGKSTMINALMCLANPRWKICTIEETPELKIPQPRWERLVTRTSTSIHEAKFNVEIRQLVKAMLRMRPTFSIVGEVRDKEAKDLFQAAATGHGGMTTFHGHDAEYALTRLNAEPLNIGESQQMLLWFIMNVRKTITSDKKIVRRTISLKEIIPTKDGIELNSIFEYDRKNDTFGISSIDELIEKSQKLQQAGKNLNLDLREDLQKKIDILDECMKLPSVKISDVFPIISKYYES